MWVKGGVASLLKVCLFLVMKLSGHLMGWTIFYLIYVVFFFTADKGNEGFLNTQSSNIKQVPCQARYHFGIVQTLLLFKQQV